MGARGRHQQASMNDRSFELPLLAVQGRRLRRDRWARDHERVEPAHVIDQGFVVTNRLRPEDLRERSERLLAAHEALRVRFRDGIDSQRQTVEDHVPGALLVSFTDDVDGTVHRASESLRSLDHAPLVHFVVGEHEQGLSVRVVGEHLVLDGWSMQVIVRDLVYGAEPPRRSYGDYVRAQSEALRGEEGRRLLRAYRHLLDGHAPVPNLAAALGCVQQGQGSAIRRWVWRSAGGSVAAIQRMARSLNTTPFVALLALWCEYIRELTGVVDIPLVIPVANRASDNADIVGWLASTAIVRVRMTPHANLASTSRVAHAAVAETLDVARLPWAVMDDHVEHRLYESPTDRGPTRPPCIWFGVTSSRTSMLGRVPDIDDVQADPKPAGMTNGVSVNFYQRGLEYVIVAELADADDSAAESLVSGFCDRVECLVRTSGRRARWDVPDTP
jgi:Condensation domain